MLPAYINCTDVFCQPDPTRLGYYTECFSSTGQTRIDPSSLEREQSRPQKWRSESRAPIQYKDVIRYPGKLAVQEIPLWI